VIVADNYFTGSKDNLRKWIGHPRFELIRHGTSLKFSYLTVVHNSKFLDGIAVILNYSLVLLIRSNGAIYVKLCLFNGFRLSYCQNTTLSAYAYSFKLLL
jgi:hypothetical protein